MKIALFINQINKYSQTWLEDQIDYLREHLVLIVVRDPSIVKKHKGIQVISLQPYPTALERGLNRIGIKSRDEINLLTIYREILKSKVDLIYIHFLYVAFKVESLIDKLDIPVLVHCHGNDVTWDKRYHTAPEKLQHPPDYQIFVRRKAKRLFFIANSKETISSLRDIGIPEDNIFLHYFGTDIPKQLPSSLPKGQFTVLYIGRLIDCKGPDLLIKAFDKACEQGMNAQLKVIGDGHLLITCQLLKARSKFSNAIHLIGSKSKAEVRQMMLDADVFSMHNNKGVLSRQEEAFGVSIIEAMAAGLPVVTGRSGGVTEIVVDQETGYLVEPGNVEEHAERLLSLYHNEKLRKEMGLRGYQRAQEYFNKEAEVEHMLKLLVNVKNSQNA